MEEGEGEGEGEGGRWSLVESDPAVFSELIRGFGATGVQVDEVWSLSAECFERAEPTHGFIFLFKWVKGGGGGGAQGAVSEHGGQPRPDDDDVVFFAKQVTENACATCAVVNLLMNVEHEHVGLGAPLTELRDFCAGFDARSKGLAVSNCATVRIAHESLERRSPFEFEGGRRASAHDAYHFVAYAPVRGRLYELDGLKDAPLDHGAPPPGDTWIDLFRRVVKARIDSYGDSEIRFNLMAVTSDREALARRRLDELEGQTGPAADDERAKLTAQLHQERQRKKRDRQEIARRRHDYLAFIVELLKILAKEGKLMALYEKARRTRDDT